MAMSGNIADFPAPDRPITEAEVEKLHSKAFRDLEGEVCDLERMGAIAQDLIMECAACEDSLRELELAVFAVWQLAKMTHDFRESYFKRWHGEKRGAS
jgi:hypothetical protein